MTRHTPGFCWFLFLLSLSWIVTAEDAQVDHVTDAERLALIKIIQQLDSTFPLIEQAEHNQSSDTRFPMNYGHLKSDIQLIRDGVNRHLSKPVRTPRRIPPVDGEYSHR